MINMNFSETVVIDSESQSWVASPRAGVLRKPLAREDAERGHATSVVRYDPGASFSAHNHPLGEEILVLEGVFSDETGDYKKGTYFRNPEGFRHAPFSKQGCTILVKLHQFQDGDSDHVCIDTQQADWQFLSDHVQRIQLHTFNTEQVALLRVQAGAKVPVPANAKAFELFLISGHLLDDDRKHPPGTWIRSPRMQQLTSSAESDALIWMKTGHFQTAVQAG